MPEQSDEEKEDIVTSIVKHFENPEPVSSSPPKGQRKFGSKYKRRNNSYKDNRKSISDVENNHGSRSPSPIDLATLQIKEEAKPQSNITKSHENGDN